MRKETWRACVQAKKEGKVKSIGISTFGIRHMQQLIEEDTSGQVEVPAVYQISRPTPNVPTKLYLNTIDDGRAQR